MPLLGATGGGSAKGFGALANLGYFIRNSLRFRGSNSAYLNRTVGSSSSNPRSWTLSFWVKRGTLGTAQTIISCGVNSPPPGETIVYFDTDDKFYFTWNGNNTAPSGDRFQTTMVFRDPSAWYHIVLSVDVANATRANRATLYVNGITQTITAIGAGGNSATTNWLQSGQTETIAKYSWASSGYLDGYLAECYLIDGQQLDSSYFGKTDASTGQWIPKKFAGTYGTNGFYLKFADASAATAAAIGKDYSGNGNNWTPNNISVTSGVTYDAMTDSPTLTSATVANYCTGNPLDVSVRGSFSNANLTATCNGGGSGNGGSVRLNTFNFTQLPVKWYWESTVTTETGGRAIFGMETTAFTAQPENWTGTAGWYLRADGLTNLTGATTFTTNDVMMFAYDGNTGKFWIGKNGTWTNSGVPASGTNQNKTLTTGTEYWLLFNQNSNGSGSSVCHMNFGQRPFAYTPPTGYKALNTFNLP